MAGQKRTRNGQVKTPSNVQQSQSQPQQADATMTEPTPPGGQPQPPSSKSTALSSTLDSGKILKQQEPRPADPKPSKKPARQPSKPHSTTRNNNQRKLPKLPNNTQITKRPLLHPALPTPFASSSAPKVLYITASTPYIPAVKRIRKLLSEITKRSKQSAATQSKRNGRKPQPPVAPSGRLAPADVERQIAEEAARKDGNDGGGLGRELVYLKATGRAIPRALELGVRFQGEADCRVRVEMGSVSAVDDVEVRRRGEEESNAQDGGDDVQEEEDIPETRIRTVSSVTVSIGLM